MKEILLNTVYRNSKNYKKFKALVDDDDFAEVKKHNWFIQNGYAATKINGFMVRLQRFVFNLHNIKADKIRVCLLYTSPAWCC